MKVAVFSAHKYDQAHLGKAKDLAGPEVVLAYHDVPLSNKTVSLADGADAVCVFVNDILDADVLEQLNSYGCKAVLLRCAGYNNVDLETATKLGFFVANVPSYSPESVAEYAVGLLQTLNRRIFTAHDRVRVGNFSLEGLLGVALHGKTVGLIGSGKIGICFARIMSGFGCKILAYDPFPNNDLLQYGKFTDLDSLLEQSDIVSLHCPLVKSTRHIINKETLAKMKAGAILVNVSRGGLIETDALIDSLKRKHLGGLAADVYEREGAVFYLDHSTDIIEDDALVRLISFPNVIITGHQAYFTVEALDEIAKATIDNLACFEKGLECANSLLKDKPVVPSKPVRM
ncbi:hypothetical protein ABW20_dc0107738 [Dactylellina cionopaga]|nr:hypothetical protein ABW20_dc0107738 [Dactylellina cionopaga]